MNNETLFFKMANCQKHHERARKKQQFKNDMFFLLSMLGIVFCMAYALIG